MSGVADAGAEAGVEWTEVDIDMMTADPVEQEQLDGLTDFEFMAYQSAQSCLGTSFSVRRSKGFLEWMAKREAEGGGGGQ